MLQERPRIRLFGTPSVPRASGGGEPLPPRETGLLAFLALHRGREHPRPVLAGTLWPEQDESSARRCLNSTLWRVRRAVADRGVDPDRVLPAGAGGNLRFDPAGPWALDVESFERAARILSGPAPAEEDLVEAEAHLALHRADLMEGYYEGWVVRERERLRLMFINGLAALMRRHRWDRPDRALELGLEILRADPLREAVHREVMRLQVRLGQRTEALRQYESFRELLRDELGVGPMEETRALHVQILREELPSGVGREGWDLVARPGRDPVTRELDAARRHLERARRLVRRASSGDPQPDR